MLDPVGRKVARHDTNRCCENVPHGWCVEVTGDQTYMLREGQILDDQYRVDRIAPPHATITYL
ncbi:MAG: hypothetical protein Q8N64_17620, partial [Hydrogenophaga sp.]|nr:hypothetical protein [Hydrogenophaga sp.]